MLHSIIPTIFLLVDQNSRRETQMPLPFNDIKDVNWRILIYRHSISTFKVWLQLSTGLNGWLFKINDYRRCPFHIMRTSYQEHSPHRRKLFTVFHFRLSLTATVSNLRKPREQVVVLIIIHQNEMNWALLQALTEKYLNKWGRVKPKIKPYICIKC